MAQENVTAALAVAAPATRVFAVLADPTTHSSIDGTGWVQEPVDRVPLTGVGQLFRMEMYHSNHPDGDYQTANKIHVYDPPRAIGWLTGYDPKGDGHLEFGGWFWRYDLVPLGPSETEVTLTYDWAGVPQSIREYLPFPPFGSEHLGNSLRHLAGLVAGTRPIARGGEVRAGSRTLRSASPTRWGLVRPSTRRPSGPGQPARDGQA